MVEFEKALWPRQIVGATVMGLIISMMGCIPKIYHPYPFTLMPLGISFWLEVGFYAVSGIWFGAWGVLAASVGSMLASLTRIQYNSSYALLISMFLSYGTFFQALISAWAFRHFKGDPQIRTSEDAWLFVVFGIFLGGLAQTLIFMVLIFPGINYPLDLRLFIPFWFFINALPSFILGFPLLLLGSKIIIKARAYCTEWFS